MEFSNSYDATDKPEKKAVQKPTGCDSQDGCDWVCSNMIKEGKVDVEKAALGGEPNSQVTPDSTLTSSVNLDSLGQQGTRLLAERILTSGSWTPEEGVAGVTISVSEDPAGVQSSITSSANKMMVGFLGMIATLALLIFA